MQKLYFIGIILSLFSSVVVAQRNYTAGEIQSKIEVTYGRFEIMMYSSDVSGTTSTFFMWKNGGNENNSRWNELDIETFGKSADSWQSNPIWEYNATDTDTKRWEETHNGLPIANTWVKFTLEWTPNYVAWFNNDIEVRRIIKGENVPPEHFRYNNGDSDDPVGYIADPMRMAFNHWATYPGNWLGPWNDADLPSYQFVDWFTYQPWNGTGFDAVSIRQDFNSITDITANYNISTHTFDDNQCQFSTNAVGVNNGYMWLGIFKTGQERAPAGAEIPAAINPIIYKHNVPGLVKACEYNNQLGLQIETVDISEGIGENLGYTDIGDFAEYTINVSEDGDYQTNFRVASLNGNAGLSLSVDGIIVIHDLVINATGGWQEWKTISDTINLAAGEHTLRFDVVRAGFNLYTIDFNAVAIIHQQNISLVQGWNLVSLYLDPTVSNVSKVFPNATTVKTADAFYQNTLPVELNSLVNIEGGEAYLVYNSINENISITGTLETRTTTNLQLGWNMLGVPTQANYVLTNLPTETIVIKDFNGFYEPLGTLNTFQEIASGKGYYIKVTANCEIVW